ncbi:MAG: alpha-amylase family glycosyl hydrolase [Bacillota bacterium]
MRRFLVLAALTALLSASLGLTPPPAAHAAEPQGSVSRDVGQRPPQDDIIYLIMTDRFLNGDTSNDFDVNRDDPQAYHGGDLQGVMNRLDYLQSLGVTAIWLTPVVQNQDRGYHGYWATDFETVDRHLGSLETLRALVQQAHQRGIKVLLDVVVNHTGPAHPWVGDPAHQDWFHQGGPIADWNDQASIENGWLYDLPDLAQENPAVSDYLLRVSRDWITKTGVDGFRLDTVRHVPKTFWTTYAAAMHTAKPGFFLMGEAWNSDPSYIADYQKAGLDALVDFPRQQAIQNVFVAGNDPSTLHDLQAEEDRVFADSSLVATFVDNHDMTRFVTAAGDDGEARLRAALAYLLTAKGIPILYYGTEVALPGGNDPDNRRDMAFGSNPAMTEWVQKLTALRQSLPALRRGGYVPLAAAPGGAVLAYARTTAEPAETAVVVINTSGETQQASVTMPAQAGVQASLLRNRLGPDAEIARLRSAAEGWTVQVTLQPYQALVLVPSPGAPVGFATPAAAAAALAALAVIWARSARRGRA